MMKTISSCVVAGALIAACSVVKKADTTGGGTGPAPATVSTQPFADNMADAPLHHLGVDIKQAAAGCSKSGYAKFDFPVGQPVKMDVTVEGPAGTCMSVSYLKASGGAVDGMMKELCVDKNGKESWDIQGLDGGSFIQMLESPPCKGATLSITAH